MVDAEARANAAALLEQFLRCEVTNDDLEARWPTSRDVALEQVRLAVWYSYDDLYPHRGPLTARPLVQRCADFLKTSLEYTGPAPARWQLLLATPLSLLTLGHSNRFLWPGYERPTWPFPG